MHLNYLPWTMYLIGIIIMFINIKAKKDTDTVISQMWIIGGILAALILK